MPMSYLTRRIATEVPVANQDVTVDEPDSLPDPADDGVANDDGPDADGQSPDERVIEDPEDEEQAADEEELAVAMA